MKVYLIRHGETIWNSKGKLQGRVDIPLSKEGIEQARLTAEGMKDIPFDHVFTSPLKRSFVTTQIIVGDRGLEINRDPRLMEICFGIYEGRRTRRMLRDPRYPRIQRLFKDPARYRAPRHGESLYAVSERVMEFYREQVLPLEGKREHVMVAGHGGILHGLIYQLQGQDISHFWSSPFGANCSAAILEVKDGKTTILKENAVFYETDKVNWSWEVY